MTREFKKLLKFIAITAATVFILDFMIGSLLEYLYNRMEAGERARAHFATQKSEADLFIFGSSRALYHYDPSILKDSLHVEAYNAGRSAQTVLYHLPVFKMILSRKKPKAVILDVNESEFLYDQSKYDLVSLLLPYYANPAVKDVVDKVSPGYRYFSWSRIVPYNSSLVVIAYRALGFGSRRSDDKGYIYFQGNRTSQLETYKYCGKPITIDPNIVDAFREFVQLCKDNQIPLLIVVSPRFMKVDCERKDLLEIKQLADSMNVRLVDFSTSPKYLQNLTFMYDEAHLNREGSIEFTKDVIFQLKHAQE